MADLKVIPGTSLAVFPLCLGGNVFAWTADEQATFAVLDAYLAGGGNFIDTADTYPHWAPGRQGGESEQLIGKWLQSRGCREQIVIATKVGSSGGLGAANVRAHAEASLKRLQVDQIDLYYAHRDDPATPVAETLRAFDELAQEGKVRHIAASNFTTERLREALAASEREGLTRYVALQPHYNLLERARYEGPLAELCLAEDLACLPYYALARGFLSGKYRPGARADTARGGDGDSLLDERGLAILAALDEIASAHETSVASVSLAWLAAQPTVLTPIASARNTEQLADLLEMAELELGSDELARLSSVSA